MLKSAAEILAIIFRLIWRKKQRDDDPKLQNLARKDELDKAITTGDANSLNRQLADLLRGVRGPKGGNGSGG